MYPAFPTLHNSRQTVIGSRTSSRRCEQTTKSKVLSGNGQGELQTSCTIQVSAVKRSASSGSRASSTRRDSYGFKSMTWVARLKGRYHPPASRTRADRPPNSRSFGRFERRIIDRSVETPAAPQSESVHQRALSN